MQNSKPISSQAISLNATFLIFLNFRTYLGETGCSDDSPLYLFESDMPA